MSAHVQTGFNEGAAVATISVTLTTTTGNAVIVTVLRDSTGGTLTQTAGDTLSLAFQVSGSGYFTDQYVATSIAGGSTTYTFTFPSTTVAMFVTEVSGLASSPFDTAATTAQIISATIPSSSISPSQACFIIAVNHGDASGSTSGLAFSNGFTIPTNGNQVGTGPILSSATAYKVGVSVSVSTTMTTDDPTASRLSIASYKEAVAASSVPYTRWRQLAPVIIAQ